MSLNPLKRVNSILTKNIISFLINKVRKSQSPQTGQFNSYAVCGFQNRDRDEGLNPLKRVNSILTGAMTSGGIWFCCVGLNPLKRVNSILTVLNLLGIIWFPLSQSPQTGQFNSYRQ